eukprot:COSAG05_NODE_2391_length_3127_cov_4.498349_3_plen_81_part_00
MLLRVHSLSYVRVLITLAGRCVFFTEGVLHSSRPNVSSQPRLALALRITTPEVSEALLSTYVSKGDGENADDGWSGVGTV